MFPSKDATRERHTNCNVPRWIPERGRISSLARKHDIPFLAAASIVGRKSLLGLLRHRMVSDFYEMRPVPGANLALLAAVARDCPESVQALVLAAGADPFEIIGVATATHMAAARRKCRALEAILNLDHKRRAVTTTDIHGICPVHVAAFYGYTDIVRLLVRHDPASLIVKVSGSIQRENVKLKNSEDIGTKSQSADASSVAELKPYLEKFPEWFIEDCGASSALHIAAGKGHVDLLHELARQAYMAECRPVTRYPHVRSANSFASDEEQQSNFNFGVARSQAQPTSSVLQCEQQAAIQMKAQYVRAIGNLERALNHEVSSFLQDAVEKVTRYASSISLANNVFDTDVCKITVRGVLEAQDDDNFSPFHCAIFGGDEKTVRCLASIGGNQHSKGLFRMSTLHSTLGNEDPGLLKIMVHEYGVGVNDGDENGSTILHYAAVVRKAWKIHATNLFSLGADVNCKNYYNWAPLAIAASAGQAKSFMEILSAGADLNAIAGLKSECTALVVMARHRHFKSLIHVLEELKNRQRSLETDLSALDKLEIVSECIAGGANVRILKRLLEITGLKVVGKEGQDLAWLVVSTKTARDADILGMVLSRGADANFVGSNGCAALHHAATKDEYSDLAKVLIGNGADVDIPSQHDDETPLHVAIKHQSGKLVRILLSAGARCDVRTKSRMYTPMHYAAIYSHLESANELIAHGADVRARDKRGLTPLHICSNGKEIASLLISTQYRLPSSHFGPSSLNSPRTSILDDLDCISNTALHTNAKFGNDKSVCALLEAGANINGRNKDGCDPFLVAAENGKLKNMVILLTHGAQLDTRNNRGQTALHLAASGGHRHVVQWLLQAGADVAATDLDGCTAMELAVRTQHWKTFRALLLGQNTDALDLIAKKSLFATESPCASKDGPWKTETGTEDRREQRHEKCEMNRCRLRCCICQMVLRNGTEVRTLQCGHIFHDRCAVTWLSGSQDDQMLRCPLCRQSLAKISNECANDTRT